MSITLALIACVCLITGCAHGRNHQMIETAGALVPAESLVTEVNDNSEGLTLEVGDYYALVYFDAGGLTREGLMRVLEDRAAEQGWTEEYRCDLAGAVKVGYSRDQLKIDIGVLKPATKQTTTPRFASSGSGTEIRGPRLPAGWPESAQGALSFGGDGVLPCSWQRGADKFIRTRR